MGLYQALYEHMEALRDGTAPAPRTDEGMSPPSLLDRLEQVQEMTGISPMYSVKGVNALLVSADGTERLDTCVLVFAGDRQESFPAFYEVLVPSTAPLGTTYALATAVQLSYVSRDDRTVALVLVDAVRSFAEQCSNVVEAYGFTRSIDFMGRTLATSPAAQLAFRTLSEQRFAWSVVGHGNDERAPHVPSDLGHAL